MDFSLFGGKKIAKTLGVDIGTHSIKVAEIAETKRGVELGLVGIAPTPPGSVTEAGIMDSAAAAGALRALLDATGIQTVDAVGAISGPSIIVRQIKMGRLPEATLRKIIAWEAKKYISFPIEDSVVECQILADDESLLPTEMNVMLAAAPRPLVESYANLLEQAGLEPLALDVGSFATMRALIDTAPDPAIFHQTVAVVDSGASYTDVNIVKDGRSVFTRTIGTAGNALTGAIVAALGCDADEADRVKMSMDVTQATADRGLLRTDKVAGAVVPLLEEVVKEIRRSINFYQSQFPEGSRDGQVDRLILSGGTGKLKGLGVYLHAILDLPVEPADVFHKRFVNLDPSRAELLSADSASMVLAVGLALRELVARRYALTAPKMKAPRPSLPKLTTKAQPA
ncbi:MAG TPA: type IV pilus assembly protein PilM [Armatimonadota bacterium]|jgi:type IV pilus assembly protein PilM